MARKYSRASSLFFDAPLALLPSKRDEIVAFWQAKLAGDVIEWQSRVEPFRVSYYDPESLAPLALELDELEEEAEEAAEPQRKGGIAVIPVHGVISQRIGLIEAMSGGISTEMVGRAVRSAAEDDAVKSIILHIDSPGGSSYGVTELANSIMDLRGTKPIIAIADSVAASAGYWIGAAADHFYVTPGGLVGSIGVYAMHQDISQMAENEGVKVTLISAGENKTRGNPYEPLSDEDLAFIQSVIDDTYERFIRDVARGRRAPQSRVRNDWGKGDVLTPSNALRVGMVDGVNTFEEVLGFARSLRPRKPSAAGARVETGPSVVEQVEQMDHPGTVEAERNEASEALSRYRWLRLQALKEAAARGVAMEV